MSTEKLKAASARRSQKKERLTFHLMLLPGMIVLLIFVFVPLLGSVMAFQDYKVGLGFFRSPWVGLENFRIIFTFRDSVQVFWNTLIIAFGKLVLNAIVPVLFSILLNELGGKIFKRAFQTIVYLPHFLSWVVIAGIWKSFLDPSAQGALNQILAFFGAEQVDLLTSKGAIRWILMLCEAWRSLGWDSIIYFTAILNISPDLYEAAKMDGANRWDIIRNIILPALLVPMTTVFILNLGFFMSAGFDQVYNFTNNAVNSVIDILDTYVNRLGIENAQYSIATAVSLIKGLVGVVLVYLTHVTSKKLTGEGVW